MRALQAPCWAMSLVVKRRPMDARMEPIADHLKPCAAGPLIERAGLGRTSPGDARAAPDFGCVATCCEECCGGPRGEVPAALVRRVGQNSTSAPAGHRAHSSEVPFKSAGFCVVLTLQLRWFYSYSHDVLGRIIEVSSFRRSRFSRRAALVLHKLRCALL